MREAQTMESASPGFSGARLMGRIAILEGMGSDSMASEATRRTRTG